MAYKRGGLSAQATRVSDRGAWAHEHAAEVGKAGSAGGCGEGDGGAGGDGLVWAGGVLGGGAVGSRGFCRGKGVEGEGGTLAGRRFRARCCVVRRVAAFGGAARAGATLSNGVSAAMSMRVGSPVVILKRGGGCEACRKSKDRFADEQGVTSCARETRRCDVASLTAWREWATRSVCARPQVVRKDWEVWASEL